MVPLRIAGEGPADVAIGRVVLAHVGLSAFAENPAGGKSRLDPLLPRYNSSAGHVRWFVLRDLDHDEPCAPALISRLVRAPAPDLVLRIAVRAVEAWLLGDAEGIAELLGVPRARVPRAPEELDDPKAELLALVRRSKRRALRDDMLPRPGLSARQGPAYAARIIAYSRELWRPQVAAERCPSLAGCIDALRRWRPGGG